MHLISFNKRKHDPYSKASQLASKYYKWTVAKQFSIDHNG